VSDIDLRNDNIVLRSQVTTLRADLAAAKAEHIGIRQALQDQNDQLRRSLNESYPELRKLRARDEDSRALLKDIYDDASCPDWLMAGIAALLNEGTA
jgi:multidrug resistance efflux pump